MIVIVFVVLKSPSVPQSSIGITPNPSVNPDALEGIQVTAAPWTAETSHLRDRLNAIGLPALSAEGTVMHIHQHLDMFIDGKAIGIPAGIGINETDRFISIIHTHDTSGVLHVESPTVSTFTLGQFFDIWGVRMVNGCIGIYCAENDKSWKAYVNGKEFSSDLRSMTLEAHDEIVLSYGTAPQTIPASYTFPAGE